MQEHTSDELTGMPGLEDLGVNLTNMEDIVDYILMIYKANNYCMDPSMALIETAPPPIIS